MNRLWNIDQQNLKAQIEISKLSILTCVSNSEPGQPELPGMPVVQDLLRI